MLKIIIAVTFAAALFVVGLLQLADLRNNKQPLISYIIDNEVYCDEGLYLETAISEMTADDKMVVAQKPTQEQFATITGGETLHSILRPKGVSEQEIHALGLTLKPHIRAKDLAAGDLYRMNVVTHAGISIVESFVIRKLDPNRLPVTYRVKRTTPKADEPKFDISIDEPKIIEELAAIAVTVRGTLYQSFTALPFGNDLMQRLMGVFAWEMRMPEDVAQGDKIELLVKKKYAEGEFIGYGKIHSVFYRKPNKTLFATFFSSKDGKITGFFNETGKSLEKEFAYSPVYETTATSNQKARLHPIMKIRIPHNGIDYRGKIGTPFYSIGDGEITELRFDVNVGNMIRIKHNYGVYSEYFHADRLMTGLSVGQRVKRGQVIGTIGRTGRLCTGPHLHMGLYRLQGKKRKFIQLASLKKLLKPAPNISTLYLTEFKSHVSVALAALSKTDTMVADR